MTGPGSLRGRRVVVTRREPGPLGSMLEARGATVIHLPLIEIVEPDDGGAALREALDRLSDFDWLVVTSPEGARRVGAAASRHPGVRLAAVGTATAAALASGAGRAVDLIPDEQLADALADALAPSPPARLLVAVADRAGPALPAALRAAGHEVTTVTAYRTISAPTGAADADVPDADALLLASGSAATAWMDRFGAAAPPIVVAIGPSTARAATSAGLKVDGVATDHSLTGLVTELERCVGSREARG